MTEGQNLKLYLFTLNLNSYILLVANLFGNTDLECSLCHSWPHPILPWEMGISTRVSVFPPYSLKPGERWGSLLIMHSHHNKLSNGCMVILLTCLWAYFGCHFIFDHWYRLLLNLVAQKNQLLMALVSSTGCQVFAAMSGNKDMAKI